jgi:hypothetical protein
MRNGETSYRRAIVPQLVTMGQVSVVESHDTSVGIPDLNFCAKVGYEAWLELKWVYEDRMPNIRPAQVAWHRRRSEISPNSFVLVGTWEGEHILIPSHSAETMKTMPNDLETWRAVSYGWWQNCPKPPMGLIMKRIEAELIVPK